jgi:hypothetical protein
MAVVSYVAFGIGALAYCFALTSMGTFEAEIASDIGNGAMLVSAVVMLWQIHRLVLRRDGRSRAPVKRRDGAA